MTKEEKLQRTRENFAESRSSLQKQRDNIYKYAKKNAGDELYNEIYQNINDSIKIWAENNLGKWRYYKDTMQLKYQVDSLLCFNDAKDKFITAILKQQQLRTAVMESIQYIYGVKIGAQWYFFGAGTLALPREYYQKNIRTPLSFETLKLLSTKHIFRNYLKSDWFGNVEINDDFFRTINERDAYSYPFTTQEAWEASWLKLCNANWEKRDKN